MDGKIRYLMLGRNCFNLKSIFMFSGVVSLYL
jgi:hypothetical protein